jgi:hypothetical protein
LKISDNCLLNKNMKSQITLQSLLLNKNYIQHFKSIWDILFIFLDKRLKNDISPLILNTQLPWHIISSNAKIKWVENWTFVLFHKIRQVAFHSKTIHNKNI